VSPRAPRRPLLGLIALVVALPLALQAFGGWSRARLGDAVARQARPGDIRMIGSVTCTYCDQARAWFDAHRVAYTECRIELDASCAQAYRTLLAPGTPVVIVRGRPLLGFDARAIAQALADAPLSDPRVQ